PYAGLQAALDASDAASGSLTEHDLRDALEGHPRIGERTGERTGGAAPRWSRQEQQGVEEAAADVVAALRDGNRRYEERFGHVFLICATGRSAPQILAELARRLDNDPRTELAEAAEEQRKIARLRLEKLLSRGGAALGADPWRSP
ncbi:MAG: 2-oxo-4-hydroxy-4-carboxy-5-ureidoimidazoline decarboxylase, partial [Streptomycetales bacterium]